MKTNNQNPFVISGYVSPLFFCNRKDESERIIKAISSGRNITLISLRRMGKTGLLKHVKQKLENNKSGYTVIYSDLLPTMNGNEMLNSISNSLIRIRKQHKNFLEKIISALASLRPKITIDPLSGQPSLELTAEDTATMQTGFEHVLELISGLDKEIVVILDEFQQIRNYPEKNMEHILRTIIQAYPSLHFVFSGSSRHMLENMFLSQDKPFYRSSELMYLGRIEAGDYSKFIKDKFSLVGKSIDDGQVTRIFEWTRLHTWYVQYVCNKLYELNESTITDKAVNKIFSEVLSGFEPEYINYRNLLTSHQFRLLIAFAAEEAVEKPTAGAFIKKYDLTTASSVTASLKSLLEKEMIVNENEKWMVYDVFFSRWLGYHYSQA